MPQDLRVALLPQLLPPTWRDPTPVAVVVDTLRFTTTACQALAAGARSVTVAAEVDAARQLAQQQSPAPLLCGERLCRPIPGFDLGNSPYEYTPQTIAGHELIFTTTNGTLAVAAARGASQILLAGLVNRTAAARALHAAAPAPAWIICSGTDGEVAFEDVLAAGAMLEALQQLSPSVKLGNDSARLALEVWNAFARLSDQDRKPAIVNTFRSVSGGGNLVDNGYQRDLDFAAQLDCLSVVPRAIAGTCDKFTAAAGSMQAKASSTNKLPVPTPSPLPRAARIAGEGEGKANR